MKRLFASLIQIHPDERPKTFLMFFYFFLTIATVYILKPVRNSLFLGALGARNLRFVYMAEGLFLILVVAVYVQCQKRVSKKFFYAGVLGFFISNLIGFWFLFRMHQPYLAAFFYVWVSSFSITMTTQFWILANDIFNPIEARRLFGLIISGGSAGGVFGGMLTNYFVRWLKTEDLLLVTAAILFFCILLLGFLWKSLPALQKKDVKDSKDSAAMPLSVRKIFMGSSYLVMLALIVMIAKIASTIVDNQFNRVVELTVAGQEARTAFFGQFMAILNAGSFFMQLFLTSLSLRYLGLGLSLCILPFGLGLTSFASMIGPVLWTSLGLKLFDGGTNYSIQQASKEMLFLPLSRALRYRVKPVIDMLGFRAAKSLAGLYIALFAPLLGLPDEKLGTLVLILIPFWFFLAWRMKTGYSKLLREHLLHWQTDRRVFRRPATRDVLNLFLRKDHRRARFFIRQRSSLVRRFSAAVYLAYAGTAGDFESARNFVNLMAEKEELARSNGLAPGKREIKWIERLLFPGGERRIGNPETLINTMKEFSPQILSKFSELLRKASASREAKRRAIRLLEFLPAQETLGFLLEALRRTGDHGLRFTLLKVLNHLRLKNPDLEFDRAVIKEELAREVETYENIRELYYFYLERHKGQKSQPHLRAAVRALLEETLERIFDGLQLLYPEEKMGMIFHRLRQSRPGEPLRIQAVELLHNTLEPGLLVLVQKIFEKQKRAEAEELRAVEILRGFAIGEDPWLSLTSLFFISALKLGAGSPELSKLKERFESSNLLLVHCDT